jgi:hypothetical protein
MLFGITLSDWAITEEEEEEDEEEPVWTVSAALTGIERTRGRVLAVNQKSKPERV